MPVQIGTSGWVYRGWKGVFYPEDLPTSNWLSFYAKNFKTVEVNSTFYRQMGLSTAASWSKKVPTDFVFAVKANRFITHIKRLLNCQDPLKRLFEQNQGFGKNLGPVLFQLPPSWKANGERLDSFLTELRSIDKKLTVVFEFRNENCFVDEIFKILAKYNAGVVINDSPHFPQTSEITASFTYVRFHGPSALYSSEYSNLELEIWAKKIKNWLKLGISVYAYFNNDVGGFAVKNAKTLILMVGIDKNL